MDNFIKKLNKIEEGCVAFSLLGIAILTFVETALRYLFSYTFPWFGEAANYTIIFSTYLGASIGVKYGTHFSMEALTEYSPDKVSHLLKTVAYFISGIMAVLFVYYGFMHLLKLQSFGVTSPAMHLPMYIPYIPIPLFSITIAFRFFALSFKHFKSFLRGEPFERVRRK
ncbi:MAG: TRAP transporter small permease subunit [Proteobacteria bacterium]|nr:TRAP transporter small permease subunit [Pseudomonadota bacterium]